MNLESKISEHLWNEIKSNYEQRSFTEAIKDAVYFLSSLIREKSGLEADGVSLVGQAFGGNNPKLKVNKLQTDSEKNVQQGIEQMLRGIYQAIRNPRAHEKYNDSQNDADSIIVFIDYLVKVIDQSKTPFSKSVFLPRIFDSAFVESERYSTLLIAEIPPKQRPAIYLEVFEKRETGDCAKLRHFMIPLFNQLSPEEQTGALQIISDEFTMTESDTAIKTAIQLFPVESWPQLHEVARLRIENKFIKSTREGIYNAVSSKCKGGAFATWSKRLLPHFTLKKEMASALTAKLFSLNRSEQDYVFEYFFWTFPDLVATPSPNFMNQIKKALKDGDKRFYDAITPIGPELDDYWKPLEKEYKEFKELPFVDEGPPESDDVPF